MSWRELCRASLALFLLACFIATGATAQSADTRKSGFGSMGAALQAMQRDDGQNPAMLWAADGAALWQRGAGSSGKSCADCHGALPERMRGVASRYPAFDAALGRPLNLGQRINQCVQERQGAPALAAESSSLLSLETAVALQSRGLPLQSAANARLAPFLEQGRQLYAQRIGQLNLSCAQCHDERAGSRLGGSTIVQGHPTGYPVYRLEWQSLGSLQRRLRNCMSGVRAEPYAFGAPELVALELFLARRAAGMPIETPGVRP